MTKSVRHARKADSDGAGSPYSDDVHKNLKSKDEKENRKQKYNEEGSNEATNDQNDEIATKKQKKKANENNTRTDEENLHHVSDSRRDTSENRVDSNDDTENDRCNKSMRAKKNNNESNNIRNNNDYDKKREIFDYEIRNHNEDADKDCVYGNVKGLASLENVIRRCRHKTHALFIGNEGFMPAPLTSVIEAKLKIKLIEEYAPLLPHFRGRIYTRYPLASIHNGHEKENQGYGDLQTNNHRALTEYSISTSFSTSATPSSEEATSPSSLTSPSQITLFSLDNLEKMQERFSDSSLQCSMREMIDIVSGVSTPQSTQIESASSLTELAVQSSSKTAMSTTNNEKGFDMNSRKFDALSTLTLKTLPQVTKPIWHAPWKLHRVISGHLGWVNAVDVDPSNEWFVTGSNDRLIKIWDLATGILKLTLTGHVSSIRDVKMSSRHPYLFSCGEDNRVKCWDLEQNRVIRDYHGHLSGVYCLALHPELDILASGGRDAVVRVWDMRTKQAIHVLSGHTGTIMALQMQTLQPHIISGSQDKMIRLWDVGEGKCTAVLTHHKKSIRSISLYPREYSFVSAASDKIKVWRCPLGRFERNILGHNSIANCSCIKDEGDSAIFMVGTNNGQLHFWDYNSGYKFDTIQSRVQPGSLESENAILCMSLDKSESRLITGECDKTIKIWKEDIDATEETHPINFKPNRFLTNF